MPLLPPGLRTWFPASGMDVLCSLQFWVLGRFTRALRGRPRSLSHRSLALSLLYCACARAVTHGRPVPAPCICGAQ